MTEEFAPLQYCLSCAAENEPARRFSRLLALTLLVGLLAAALACGSSPGQGHVAKGDDFLESGQLDEAIREYNKAVNLDPKLALAYAGRGEAYRREGQYDTAITDATKAAALDPRPAFAYAVRGEAYRQKRDYDAAIADLSKAIELDRKAVAPFNNRGAAYAAKGQYDAAIADLNRAIELDAKSAPTYANRAAVYLNKNAYDLALADASKAIELDPKLAVAYSIRARAYLAKGECDRAAADAHKAGGSVTTPTAPPAVPTIEGNWLLYDEVGANFVTFDAKGSVVGYQPPELAPNISGCGSVKGDAMTFNATGFTSRGGQTYSAWYIGTRVRDEDLAGLGLPQTLAGVPVFFGELQRSDLPGIPISVVAIKR